MIAQQTDMAGKEYWDSQWNDSPLPALIDPRDKSLGNYVNRRLDKLFRASLSDLAGSGKSLLEVGCAQSVWLPYFASELGFKVTGLDYSELGCQKERRMLASARIDGTVVCADMFSPPEEMIGAYDVVTSFGVVEHFSDTGRCISALARFLKPGGRIITLVPNMRGMMGWTQRAVNETVFKTHVPLSVFDLRAAHESADIVVGECQYLLSANFFAINCLGSPGSTRNRLLMGAMKLVTAAVWVFESAAFALPASRTLSPYVVCIGNKAGCQAQSAEKTH